MYGYLGLRAGTQSCFAGEKMCTLLGADTAHCENDVGGTTCENIKDKNKKTVKQFIGILCLFKAKSTSGESLEGIYTFWPTLYATFGMGELVLPPVSLNSLIPDI